jgi:hypothetical protein
MTPKTLVCAGLLALLPSIASAQASCPSGPTSTVTIQRYVEQAEFALVDLDDAGLDANRGLAVETVLCLGELVHPPHAASFLRLEGVYAFVKGNRSFAVDAFRSALTIQPDFQLRAALAPAGGPLAQLYDQARNEAPSMWALPQLGKPVFVNGVSTTHAPRGLAILQVVEPSGQVSWSGIVTGPQDLPSWFVSAPQPQPLPQPQPVLPAPQPEVVPLPPPVPEPVMPEPITVVEPLDPIEDEPGGKTAKIPILAAAGGMLVAAGGLYGGSVIMRGRYNAAPTAPRRQLTNALFFGSVGAGVLSVGLGTVGIALPAKKRSSEPDPPGVY